MSRPSTPRQPLIETLESRLMLAVTAVVSGADLQIVGDEFDNSVIIAKAGNRYTLLGDVTGDFDAPGRLIINMGGGSDMVQLQDVLVGNDNTGRLADVLADMGSGNDTLSFMHVQARNVMVTAGDGMNNIGVLPNGGQGSVISGLLSYVGGSGSDSVMVSESTVGRVAFAAGDDVGAVHIISGSTVGPILYEGGSGVDQMNINEASAGAVTARMGGGNNVLAISLGQAGKVNFWAEGGDDTVSIYGSACGATFLSLGEGTNDVGIFQSNDGSETPSSISGNLQILGGASDDIIAMGAVAIAGSVKALLGDGSNQLAMVEEDAGSTNVGKPDRGHG